MVTPGKTISVEKAKSIILQFSEVFDIVRFVDATNVRVLVFHNDNEVTYEPYACYKVWKKINRCENCISINSCRLNKRMSKFEFVDNDVYEVVSTPFKLEMEDGSLLTVSLELVNNSTDEIVFEAYGRENLIDKINETNKAIYRDSLTGVYNRRFFDDRIFCYAGTNNISDKVAFIMIDMRKFKDINDAYGHIAGDTVLRETGECLLRSVRPTDFVIRYGGDEFLVVINGCLEAQMPEKIAKIRNSLSTVFYGPEKNIPIIADIGWVFIPDFVCNDAFIQAYLEKADNNMYREKHNAPEK